MTLSQDVLWRRQPATRWDDALPTGSGKVGAMVYGNIRRETILLNHEALFLQAEPPDIPDISAHLPEVRGLLMAGRYDEAENFLHDRLMDAGVVPSRPASYQPAFDLKIQTDPKEAFTRYRGRIDFSTAEVMVTWDESGVTYTRDLFVSRENDVVVLRVRASEPGTIDADFFLDKHLQTRCDFGARIPTGGEPEAGVETESSAGDGWLELRGVQTLNGVTFGGAARVVVSGGDAVYEGARARISGADEVLILLKLYVYADPNEAIPALRAELEALPSDYDALLEGHIALHRPIYERVRLDLGAEARGASNEELLMAIYEGGISRALSERMFNFGRYLLICSSGDWPANLQGVWNGDYLPPWQSDYHNDENIQMNYWQALPGNMPELTLAYFDYYESFLDDYRTNARNLFGCRGIWIPIAQTTHGCFYHGPWLNWPSAAPWLAQLFYDYYLFTGDRDFLKGRAVPFLKEVALFYEDYLFEGEDGQLVFAPSLSPENVPQVENGSLCAVNATMDIALAREVLGNLCDACDLLGIDREGIVRWQGMLAKLPDYKTNEDGAMREWLWPGLEDRYKHRHLSHIYPLFPGFEITEESDPAFYEACRVAVEKRLVVGLSAQVGWSYAHMISIYARLGQSARALECLSMLARSSTKPNLLTAIGDWRDMGLTWDVPNPPFQIDANFGITAGILEMLVFSVPGMIKLLPALPADWPRGSITGVRCRGGVTVDVAWDTGRLDVSLIADADQTVTVKFPAPPEALESQAKISKSAHGPAYREVVLPAGEAVKMAVVLAV